MKVVYKSSAIESIEALSDYLTETILMPETGIKYAKKMLAFGDSIGETPSAYSLCKNPVWQKLELHCATFDKTWVFAFKIIKKQVVIHYIVNGKLLNY